MDFFETAIIGQIMRNKFSASLLFCILLAHATPGACRLIDFESYNYGENLNLRNLGGVTLSSPDGQIGVFGNQDGAEYKSPHKSVATTRGLLTLVGIFDLTENYVSVWAGNSGAPDPNIRDHSWELEVFDASSGGNSLGIVRQSAWSGFPYTQLSITASGIRRFEARYTGKSTYGVAYDDLEFRQHFIDFESFNDGRNIHGVNVGGVRLFSPNTQFLEVVANNRYGAYYRSPIKSIGTLPDGLAPIVGVFDTPQDSVSLWAGDASDIDGGNADSWELEVFDASSGGSSLGIVRQSAWSGFPYTQLSIIASGIRRFEARYTGTSSGGVAYDDLEFSSSNPSAAKRRNPMGSILPFLLNE